MEERERNKDELALLCQLTVPMAPSPPDLKVLFAEDAIVPNVIDEAPPQVLNLRWDGLEVKSGQLLATDTAKSAPRFTAEVNPHSLHALIMIDPDNLSRDNPCVAEWLHWLIVNIPPADVADGINGGEHKMPYGCPCPAARTGLHRYIVLIYEQKGRIELSKMKSRAKFSAMQFAKQHNFGTPVAGNYFLCSSAKY